MEAQDVNIPLRPEVEREKQLDVCVLNRSRVPIQIGGKPGVGISIRFPTADETTWLASAGKVARRFQYGRFNPLGAGGLWIALALGLASAVAGTVIVIRTAR